MEFEFLLVLVEIDKLKIIFKNPTEPLIPFELLLRSD